MSAALPIVLATALLSVTFPSTSPTPLPDRIYIHNTTSPAHNNKTIADLVDRQTDTIKQIVSNHHRLDYPILATNQRQNDHIPLDVLKTKCQHLARLVSTTTTTAPPSPRPSTSGFYITTEEPPPTTPKPSPSPVKYIKLEPVILQKTIMSDGRTIFYWHKSIPSQIAPLAPLTPPPITTTTPTTTTPSSGYIFRNFFPSFYSVGGPESAPPTTTEKTTTAEEMQLYQQQLKFVVPVPYAPPDDPGIRKPWDFDQHAYYPRPLQPDNVNMQVPYVPTFHVIKAIAVPNQYEGGESI